jgi:hypothetical protein
MRAKVVDAEAQVPLAMADTLREGKLGVMDYYNLQNILAVLKSLNITGSSSASNWMCLNFQALKYLIPSVDRIVKTPFILVK